MRFGGRKDALFVAADAGGGTAARVVVVRTVLRAHAVRQLLRRLHVDSQDDGSGAFVSKQ